MSAQHVSPPRVPFDSDALRANIGKTAQDLVIPDRYLPLVEAVDRYYGVRIPLTETLGEYFHAFRNTDSVIDGLQAVLLRNWTYFERSEERAKLFSLLSELVLGLLECPLSDAQLSLLLRQILMWCNAALSGPHPDAYADAIRQIGEVLQRLLPQHAAPFLDRDVLLRALVTRVAAHPGPAPVFRELFRRVLLVGYRRAGERLDIPGWATSAQDELTEPWAVGEAFSFLTGEHLTEMMNKAAAAPDDRLVSPDLPLFSDLIGRIIDQVFRVENLEDRFAICLYLLKDDTMGHRQSEVMGDLLGVVKELMVPERHMDAERILSRLTAFFKEEDYKFPLIEFRCYEAIGVAIGQAGNEKAANHMLADILYWRFQYPDLRGATDEWEVVVNPYHLPKIRFWMHIIESNPALYDRLAAALNVQLRLGGVYIADTDLFQRDVTQFLNADIRPIYFEAKQLLRTLPVFFNEVGAEGELRAVTTEMDEICARGDTLMHFLRKQAHTESSNRLVAFSRAVVHYWLTRDPSGLKPFLSENTMTAVRGQPEWADGPHRILASLRERRVGRGDGEAAVGDGDPPIEVESFLDELLTLSPTALTAELDAVAADDLAASSVSPDAGADGDATNRRRVALMVRTHQLLAHKYSLVVDDLGGAVSRHVRLASRVRRRFQRALTAWQADPCPANRDRLLDAALTTLEGLKAIILDPAPSSAVENIYQKRHIAVGIPSIYGTYAEPKFDALGLSFRVESLVSRLFDDIVDEGIDPYITRDSLRRMWQAMKRFERALAVDGVDSRSLAATLGMLETSFSSHNFTFHQYQNVYQFLANNVAELSRNATLSHEQVLHEVLVHDTRLCEERCMPMDAVAEMVLREVLVAALGMQALDRYVGAALRQISTLHGRCNSQALTRMMNYDPDRLISPIDEPRPHIDDQMTLGFKGLGLKQMTLYGHHVPPGFVLTTELFAARPAMSYRPLYDDVLRRIREALGRLEGQADLRLGDPGRPLLLSIRSGAAISMPGLMTTFVNVGLNDDLTEALSRRPNFEWAAWDNYRRFLQSWAMSAGVDRDVFDDIMSEYKGRYGVKRKLDFTPAHMREIAFAYKTRALDAGVVFLDDPFRQVISCVLKVLDSWDSSHARLYRQYTGIAEEWGTAVVVQRMVFGNLSRESGSGVVFTSNPLEPYSRQVRLFGDFAMRCQGDDVVGGLVFPLPISEAQRLGSPTYRDTEHSLERDFPEIYWELLTVARDLVSEREFDPQEIEFTFESPLAEDLYILQKRAAVQEQTKDAAYFDTSSPHYRPPVAVGMGVSGGAYSGRAAVNAEQIDRLLAEAPGENIVLLRPDTVPDDIAMIARVSAILTARGGVTSHAAVTAKRLGKTAVVDCVALEVIEHQGAASLAGHELHAGDWLSIDGRTGNIFLGRIPVLSQAASGH